MYYISTEIICSFVIHTFRVWHYSKFNFKIFVYTYFLHNFLCIFKGFPRTLFQAQAFWKEEKLDLAVNLVVPFSVIMERVEGRMVHLQSGRVYNSSFNIPKVPVSTCIFFF